MNVCLIGAGRMGSLYGGLIARGGHAVTLYDRWAAHIAAIRQHGLRLRGLSGDLRIPVAATTDASEVAPCDLAIVLVDTNGTAEAAEVARRVLAPDGYAVTLQNGVGNVETLTEALGAERVVGGLSYHSAALIEPGVVDHTHAGPTWLGEIIGGGSPRVDALAQVFRDAGFDTVIVDDIIGYIWNKFVHNCAINPISAVSGLRVGEIARNPAADELQTRIVEEALAVVAARGIRLPEHDPLGAIKAFCRIKFNKPSMQQHMEEGRRTEIDALNGAIVREGRRFAIATPYNDALTMMVKAREAHMQQMLHEPPVDYDRLERDAKASAS